MKKALLFLFILFPAIEITFFIWAGMEIGFLWLFLLIVATGLLGVALARREGIQTYRRAKKQMQNGQPPTDELLNGTCILIGGFLLLLPGFFSDLIGLLFLLPFTRKRLRYWVQALLMRLIAKNTIRVYRR
ncbi:membrane protein FxsA [Terribacillus saccharophilus]|uniref:Membrane protein FxsA n=1 Tax=Terribacillus saccharophilus TaxID=361277 RepID=A0A268H9R5_9BACI|nr:FxsA family protein [Terribacillus saccharophilus]PAE06617.1 membrane protein FxsA [Terribacillus saccharophilus]